MVGTVLCRIRPRPRSIHLRPWAAKLHDGLTVLDWCAQRLRIRFPDHRHTLVVDSVDAEYLRGLPERSYEFVISAEWSDVAAWLDAAQQLGADEIVAVHLEAALCPADLSVSFNDALNQTTGLVSCTSLPAAVAPERVNVRAATALRRAIGDRGGGGTFNDLFALAEMAKVQDIGGHSCRCLRIDSSRRVPAATPIAFESKRDIETLQRIAASDGDPLEHWLADRAVQLRRARQRATTPATSATPRVLFVSNPSAVSGAESSTVELIRALRRKDVDAAALVAFEGDFTDRLRSAGSHVYCPDRDFIDDGIESWNIVSDAFADFQPDVVHYCGRSGRIPLQVAAAMKRPVVFHGHVPFSEPYRDAAGWANRFVAVSASVSDAMLVAGLDPNTIVHIPNGIDPDSYAFAADERKRLREEQGIAPDTFVVVTLGRLSPEKRLVDVVEALSLARRDGSPIELVMAGEAHSSQTTLSQITARVQELELAPAVRMLGQLTDVRPLLGAANALVICSEYEGLPMAALEAMAAGVPIVATEAGALADLVGDRDDPGICGLRVRQGRPDDIAAALRRLNTHPRLASALGREGQCLARGPFSISATADKMLHVYRDLVRPSLSVP